VKQKIRAMLGDGEVPAHIARACGVLAMTVHREAALLSAERGSERVG